MQSQGPMKLAKQVENTWDIQTTTMPAPIQMLTWLIGWDQNPFLVLLIENDLRPPGGHLNTV